MGNDVKIRNVMRQVGEAKGVVEGRRKTTLFARKNVPTLRVETSHVILLHSCVILA